MKLICQWANKDDWLIDWLIDWFSCLSVFRCLCLVAFQTRTANMYRKTHKNIIRLLIKIHLHLRFATTRFEQPGRQSRFFLSYCRNKKYKTLNFHFSLVYPPNSIISRTRFVFVRPFKQMYITGKKGQHQTVEQTKMPKVMLEGPRPCTIFCFAFIHYAWIT